MSGPGHFYAQIVAHLGMTVPSKEATIATGAITVKSGRVRVDTEADAASDNLDTINGMSDGDMAYLQPESGARTVVLRDGVGNLSCPGGLDISLADADDMVLAYHNGTNIVIIPLAIDASATAPLIFRGVITVAADFPTLAAVRPGWYYRIAADVTDNDATKTNTGAVFEAGSEIAWTGAAWADFGAGWMATSAEITTATSSVLALSPGQTAGAILTVLGMLFVDAVRVEIDGAGAIAKSQGYMSVDGAGATADDLDDISGLSAGEFLVLAADDPAGAPITIRHAIGAGKIATPGGQPIILAAESDRVLLLGGTTQATVVAVSTAAGLGRHNVETLAAGKVIATGEPAFQTLDPDAATRVVTLPVEEDRRWYFIRNSGDAAADILTVNNDAAGLVATVNAGETLLVVSDGATWTVGFLGSSSAALASTVAGLGATRIGIADALAIITATTVEGALAELATGPSSTNEEVLAAGKTLVITDPHLHRLDPDAATRVVTLPAEADRLWYWLVNTGTAAADILTVNNDAAGLVATVNAGESLYIASDGTNWHVLSLGPSSALLASILAGGGASRIGLFDTAGFWAGADLETVLTALGVLIGGTNDAARDYTEENVVADDESLFASINKLDVAFAEKVGDEGCVAVASLDFVNQPNANDTLTIGADVYEFGGVGGNINVVIGGTPAATLTNLVTAINGSGTENIFGQAAGTDLRILSADGAGGTPVGADPSIVLAEAITHINSIWNVGNVNMNTLGGRAKAARRHSATEVVVTAAMIANSLSVAFPFAVVSFLVQAHDPAAGTIRFGTDVFMVGGGGDVACTFGGGAAPDIQVNDVLTVEAWGA